nr:MAG: internal scaffolding protein [Microvirus sp.]
MKYYFVEPQNFRVRAQTEIFGESMTHESFKDETDINAIVGRYARTGELPPALHAPQYADVTGLQGDFTVRIGEARSTLAKVEQAKRTRQVEQLEIETEIRTRVLEEVAARQGGNAPTPPAAPVAAPAATSPINPSLLADPAN